MRRIIADPARAVALALALALPGCSTVSGLLGTGRPAEGTPGFVRGFIGAVAADEPRAVLAARQVLASGGNAADAAVALGLALAVTLPSRAGLGSGGACLALKGDTNATGIPEAILFLPPAGGGGDRPAAAPMLARGLFLLHARHGKARFETLMQPAETLAREGTPVSRAFAADLQVVGGALASDGPARLAYFPGGRPPAEGEVLLQPDLGSTLAQLRRAGVGDLYVGTLAQRLVQASAANGTGLTAAALRAALPSTAAPITIALGQDLDADFLPAPADGGAAATGFQALRANRPASPARARRPRGGAGARQRARRAAGQQLRHHGPRRQRGGLRSAWATCSAPAAWRPAPASCSPRQRKAGCRHPSTPPACWSTAAPKRARSPPAARWPGRRTLRRQGPGRRPRVAFAATINPAAAPEPGRTNVIACTGVPAKDPETCGWATDSRIASPPAPL